MGSPGRPRWDRRRAALGVVGVVFALDVFRRATTPVGDQDAFWVASAGRAMLATHAAPSVNGFSFTDPAHPWVFHELLFGLAYAQGLTALGPAFFDLFGAVLGSVTILIVLAHVLGTTKAPMTAPVVILPLLVEIPLFHPRPPFVALAFASAMTALAFGARFSRERVAAAVALEWVWALSHGSFPLGIVILLCAAVEAHASRDRERRHLLVVAASCGVIATFVNPYGAGLHGLVARYLLGDNEAASVVRGHIVEFLPVWQAPFAFGRFDAPAVALVTLASAWCVASRRSMPRALLVLALSVMSVFQIRNVHLALVLGAMLLAPELDNALSGAAPRPLRAVSASAWTVLPGLFLAVVAWGVLFASLPREAWLGPNVGGPGLLPMIDRIPDDAKVYAPFGISPAVIWYAGPRGVRVFYDSRNDCYAPPVALASFTMEDPGSTPDATLTQFGAEYALVRRGGPVADALSASSRWTVVAGAPSLVLFERSHLASPQLLPTPTPTTNGTSSG